jgi:carboxylesterase
LRAASIGGVAKSTRRYRATDPTLVHPALALFAVAAIARAIYPRFLERRQSRRRPLGPDGVIIGAARRDLHRPRAHGVLLIHGGGDTPQTLDGLARHLHSAGFSVRVPLLAGHGRALSALTQSSARQWHDEVRSELESLRESHEKVAVVGLSMGGALALKLASEQRVDALVLLAPYIAMPGFARGMARTSYGWGWLLPYFTSMGSRSIRDPAAAERALGHGILTPAALRALYDVMNDAVQALPRVTAPTLVIQSREDNRITPEDAELAFARLGASDKKFVWVHRAAHVITVDFGHQRVFELTSEWLESHL